MLVDSHAHLDSPDFRSDLEQVIERAAAAGVKSVLAIGCVRASLDDLSRFMEILESYEHVYGAAGSHPHDAQHYSEQIGAELETLMRHPKMLAWGEIGLDFYYDHSPREQQIEVFRNQLRRAKEAGKPVIIHSREAPSETCRVLSQEFSDGPGAVLHCFTYDLETARACLELGFYLSVGGILTFPKGENLRSVVKQLPLERLLIETDSPYLAPAPFRGKRNEPAYVVRVAETLAELHGTTKTEIGKRTKENFEKLFKP